MKYDCEICGVSLPDYEPKYCCSGFECGCLGMVIEPAWCSKCWDEKMESKYKDTINLTQGDLAKHFWSGIYFHGDLEEQIYNETKLIGDLVGSDIECPTEDCILDVKVHGVFSKAYIWLAPNLKIMRGLVVSLNDEDSLSYAKEKYREKSDFL